MHINSLFTYVEGPCGETVIVSDFGSEGCGFKSRLGHIFLPSECTSHHLYFIIFHLCYFWSQTDVSKCRYFLLKKCSYNWLGIFYCSLPCLSPLSPSPSSSLPSVKRFFFTAAMRESVCVCVREREKGKSFFVRVSFIQMTSWKMQVNV